MKAILKKDFPKKINMSTGKEELDFHKFTKDYVAQNNISVFDIKGYNNSNNLIFFDNNWNVVSISYDIVKQFENAVK